MARLGRAQPFKPLVMQRNLALLLKGVSLTETITGTDSVNRSLERALTETLTGTDSLTASKVTLVTLTESTTLTEATVSFSTSAYVRSLTETITGTESISVSGLWTNRTKVATSWTIRPAS